MRKDRIIQRCVFVDERSLWVGLSCPFQRNNLKYSHLQRVLSSAFLVKYRKTYASIPADMVTRMLCLHTFRACLQVHLPAVHESACRSALFRLSDFCHEYSLGIDLKRHHRCEVDTNLCKGESLSKVGIHL